MSNKCNADNTCTFLGKQIVEYGMPGFSKIEQIVNNGDGPQKQLHSVGYKKSAKSTYFALVVCPWCEGEPGRYKRIREGDKA